MLPDGGIDRDAGEFEVERERNRPPPELHLPLDCDSPTGLRLPRDLDEAVRILEESLRAEFVAYYRDSSWNEFGLATGEFGSGLDYKIARSWGLDREEISPLISYMMSLGLVRGDFTTMILKCLHRHLRRLPLDIDGEVRALKARRPPGSVPEGSP